MLHSRTSNKFVVHQFKKYVDEFSIHFLNVWLFQVQIHELTPLQSASGQNINEEVQQLRTQLSDLKTECTQLAEANRAWQEYHENQLNLFRKNLEDWIFLDENTTLEQIGQQIINQFDQLGRNKQSEQQSGMKISRNSLKNITNVL